MTEILVGKGWWDIVSDAIDEAAAFPPEWMFVIVSATRDAEGGLRLDASYNPFDIPHDDHLPAGQKLAHPWRALQRIRAKARLKSLGTCEVCGYPGRLRGIREARVRSDST
jgi:hypothetical protein